jgi:radical SAM superfamily enzyme YgiQ (UPF0313 family)
MPKAAVLLINPPNPPGYVSNKDSMGGFGQLYGVGAPPFPPLDLPYLAGAVTAAGFETVVIEAGALRLDLEAFCAQVREAAGSDRPMVVMRTSLPTIDWDLEVCAALRAGTGVGPIYLYGAAVKPLLARIKQDPAIDGVIVGEPDGAVVEILSGAASGDVAGLVFRDGGGWIVNPERPFEKKLDELPFPRWDLLPHHLYAMPRSAAAGEMRFLPMLTSRGCPFGCNYCPYPIGQGLPWRPRSADNVVDEIEHLVRDLGVEYIIFRDPLFSANKKRVAAICEEILRRGIRVEWRCETRLDLLDEDVIALMARAGCTGVNFGVESSDPQVQKNVERKPITEAQFIATIALLRKYEISTFAFFVAGLPGDTIDTILDTIRFSLKLRATWTQFTVATPFIGTRLHEWAAEHGLIAPDRYKLVSSHEGSIGNENLSPEQVHLLHRLGQILARNVLNRRGLFKNERRRRGAYALARRAADLASYATAHLILVAAEPALRWKLRGAARGPATIVAHRKRLPIGA